MFHLCGIGQQHPACFGDLPHYGRFVGLVPRLFVPLMVLLHGLSGEETGRCLADASRLAACHKRCIGCHRGFNGLAARCSANAGSAACTSSQASGATCGTI